MNRRTLKWIRYSYPNTGSVWRTKTGHLVRQDGSIWGLGLGGPPKIRAYNVKTGGFRGLLRVDRLRLVRSS